MIKELNLNNTYMEVHNNSMNIISRYLDYMVKNVKNDIDVQEQHEQLPSFYWLHKKPYGSRFIVASNTCTTKQLSSLLTSCFKTILIHYKQYCDGIYELIVFGLLTTLQYWTGYIKLIRPQELENLIVTILLHYIRISHTMPR